MSSDDCLQRGDVILVSKRAPLSLIVRWATNSRWSHSALYLGNGEVVDAAFGGVKVRPASTYLRHPHAILRADKFESYQVEDAVRKALSFRGEGYDYLGLVGIGYSLFLKKQENPWDAKSKRWCSELVADAYISAGLDLSDLNDRDTWLVSPQDLQDAERFRTVYESPAKSFL